MRVPSASRRFMGWLVMVTVVMTVAASGLLDAQEAKKASRPRVVEVPITPGLFNNGKPVIIDEGDTVVWVNKDVMPHSASRYTNEGAYDEGGRPTDQPFNTGFIQPGKKSPPITFLKATDSNKGLEYACDVHEKMSSSITVRARPQPPSSPPSAQVVHHHPPSPIVKPQRAALHSFLVTGGSASAMFLHHYGLFNDPNHEFHVTLEARLQDAAAREAYEAYRRNKEFRYARAIVDVSRGAAAADHFLTQLPDLVKAGGTFPATISHNGKLAWTEDRTQWGSPIQGLVGVTMEITRIIQFRHFDPKDKYPASLIYQLYGTNGNVFLAHEVTAKPSFLHVLQLADPIPPFLTPELIRKNPLVAFPSKRLKAGGARSTPTAVLSGNTNILLGPPTSTIDFEPPLQNDEVVMVLIEGDNQPRQLKIGPTIFYDHRILNR